MKRSYICDPVTVSGMIEEVNTLFPSLRVKSFIVFLDEIFQLQTRDLNETYLKIQKYKNHWWG